MVAKKTLNYKIKKNLKKKDKVMVKLNYFLGIEGTGLDGINGGCNLF